MLRQHLAAARESQDYADFPVSDYEIEGLEIRLDRVRAAIEQVEGSVDVGGWEDH